MILIREATEDDNDALNELQKKCPAGTSLVLGVDSSPDYFARSRPFRDWHVFVAVENNVIVGSAGFAIYDTYIEGKEGKTAYEYGFVVDPFHRRRGIAEKLQRHIEHIAMDNGVDTLHLDIMEENTPSISLFVKMGFEKVKDCKTFHLTPYKKQKTAPRANIRSMIETDVDDVTNLINETYRNYDFFAPYQPKDFLESLRRMPHFDIHNILVLEDNDEIRACLGYWNYNKVRRYIVLQLNWKLKAQTYLIRLIGLFAKMPYFPKTGEPLSSYNLIIMAYRDPYSLTELVKNVVNIALENKINIINVTVDPKNPTATVLSQFTHVSSQTYFFAKSLRQAKLPNFGERKLYIDALEM